MEGTMVGPTFIRI